MSQLFKEKFDKNILYNFLKQICSVRNNCYILTKESYKKAQLLNILTPFLTAIEEQYYDSKKYYAQRQMKFTNLITILRQICRHLSILWTSEMKYDKSKYYMIYYVYFTNLS
jgi:hypothetical protein